MAFAPADLHNEEAELLVQNEAPIATRLRNRSKVGNVQSSQNTPTLGIDENNQSDKPIQPSRNQLDKSNGSTTKKSAIHTSSSCRTGQPSTDLRAKKSNVSTPKTSVHVLSPSGTSKPFKGAKNSSDSTPRKNEVRTSSSRSSQPSNQVAMNSKDSAPKSEAHILSSYRASQTTKDRSGKDSTPKRSEMQASSSCRTSLPLKDQDTRNSTASIPETSEIQSKHYVKNQSDTSQTMSEIKALSRRRTIQYAENQDTKEIKSSRLKSSDFLKPFSSNAGQDQNEMTGPSEELPEQSEEEDLICYIRWKDFDKLTHPTGWNCELCEKDLAYSPVEEGLEQSLPSEDELEHSFFLQEEAQEEFETSLLPETTILPCSHVFHSTCLELALSREQLSDPLCPLCLSLC